MRRWQPMAGSAHRQTPRAPRARRRWGAGALVACALASAAAGVDARQAPRTVKINFFANMVDGDFGSLYLMSNGDCHSLVIGAEDETLVIDTKRSSGWGAPILAKASNVIDMPVKRIINTSARNSASNAEFTTATEIIAHERTKANMAGLPAFSGAGARFLPNRTFADALSFPVSTTGEESGKNRVDLHHFGPAATSGDIVVVLPQYGVVFLGEVFPGKMVPAVDLAMGGSMLAFPGTLDRLVAMLKGLTGVPIVVPGCTPPPPDPILTQWATASDVEEYARFMRDFVTAGTRARKAGASVDAAVAGLDLATRYKGYAMDNAVAAMAVLYEEIGK